MRERATAHSHCWTGHCERLTPRDGVVGERNCAVGLSLWPPLPLGEGQGGEALTRRTLTPTPSPFGRGAGARGSLMRHTAQFLRSDPCRAARHPETNENAMVLCESFVVSRKVEVPAIHLCEGQRSLRRGLPGLFTGARAQPFGPAGQSHVVIALERPTA